MTDSLIGVRLIQPEGEEQHDGQDEGENDGAPITQQPSYFQPEHREIEAAHTRDAPRGEIRGSKGSGAHRDAPGWIAGLWLSSLVRAMKASSRPRVLISMSRAGLAVSRYRAT